MNAPQENPPSFQDSIKLGVPMTPEKAIALLASFHGATSEQVCTAFINLRGFEQGTVTFRKGIQNGWEIIVMEGTPNGSRFPSWNHLIDRHTGRPLQRTG